MNRDRVTTLAMRRPRYQLGDPVVFTAPDGTTVQGVFIKYTRYGQAVVRDSEGCQWAAPPTELTRVKENTNEVR